MQLAAPSCPARESESAFRASPARTERRDRTTAFRHELAARIGTYACADEIPAGSL
jgi:hypothetical protein